MTWPITDTDVLYYRIGILCLLCLQCKAPFTLHTVPYSDAHTWMHSDVCRAELDLCGMLHPLPYGYAVCMNNDVEINMLHYSVAVRNVNGVECVIIGLLLI